VIRDLRESPLRVLLIDENEVNCQVIEAFLYRTQAKVEILHNGEEALAIAEKGKLDLVLMDIEMPVMSGIETIKRIRHLDEPIGNVPIIALRVYLRHP